MAAKYGVENPVPPWKSSLDGICDALDHGGCGPETLSFVDRRNEEDTLSATVYSRTCRTRRISWFRWHTPWSPGALSTRPSCSNGWPASGPDCKPAKTVTSVQFPTARSRPRQSLGHRNRP